MYQSEICLGAPPPHRDWPVFHHQCFPPEADMIDALDFYFQVSHCGHERYHFFIEQRSGISGIRLSRITTYTVFTFIFTFTQFCAGI